MVWFELLSGSRYQSWAWTTAPAPGFFAGRGQVDDLQLFSPQQVQQIGKIQTRARDRVLGVPMRWRLGYHLVLTTKGVLDGAFGHFGFGGSGGWADPHRDVAIAMVCNRGSGTPVGDLRLLRLGTAALLGARRRRETLSRGPARPLVTVDDGQLLTSSAA